MPHLAKKIVNAFQRNDNKTSTDLKFCGQKCHLKHCTRYGIAMLAVRMGDIHTHILTKDHFVKQSQSYMCDFLAVPVMSQSMLRLIELHAETCDGVESYNGIVEIINSVDWYVFSCQSIYFICMLIFPPYDNSGSIGIYF